MRGRKCQRERAHRSQGAQAEGQEGKCDTGGPGGGCGLGRTRGSTGLDAAKRITFGGNYWSEEGVPGGFSGKESACQCRDTGSIPGLEDPLEEEMATNPRILASERPWTEEPGGLQYMGSKRDTTEQLSTCSIGLKRTDDDWRRYFGGLPLQGA